MLEYFLSFLMTFMPASDKAEYTEDFFRGNVKEAMAARAEVSWEIPDSIFLHFVLPVRVNNENLDSARFVFHKELAPIVKGRSMRDAVLEVNHWCHEHVTYQPSDARTSSPLATLRTAWGRCGEESTLLVSALRSVAIPARQVYTPRWAHTDDNHAWVEAWVDGEWCFLGACEPEPVLNLGWFNAPASRAMLMHTKVFGDYHGPEDVMSRTHQYTEINVIGNYAQSAKATVEVRDLQGDLVPGAEVHWGIYNYAEFYTVSQQTADAQGRSSLTAGLGDMMVTAYAASDIGFAKVDFRHTDKPYVVTLNHTVGEPFEEDFDIAPPAEHNNVPYVSPEQRAENDRRLTEEDQKRLAYRATFPTDSLLVKAEGNYQTIIAFLHQADNRERALALLNTLSDKDWRDVTLEVLTDHLTHTDVDEKSPYVICPRISNERLTPWRASLQKVTKGRFRSAEEMEAFCRDSISLIDELTLGGTYMTPMAMWNTRSADRKSLPILFVALCRARGINAWYDPATGNTFYSQDHGGYKNGEVSLAQLSNEAEREYKTGHLTLTFEEQPYIADPEYMRHFTLKHFNGKSFSLIDYDDFIPLSTRYGEPEEVEAGYYLLTTGRRMADGSVRCHLSGFEVKPGSDTKQTLSLRSVEDAVSVIGAFNSEASYTTTDGEKTTLLKSCGRGYFVVGLLGVGQEPTNHALRDIALRKKELEAWGRPIVLLFPSQKEYEQYRKEPIEGLPNTVLFGIDNQGAIRNEIVQGMKLDENAPLPHFVVADTFNRVVFERHGYTIGLGDQLVEVLHQLK